ncbi:MAG: 6,7-dimethyl-8-ribityllumazine synthase [Chitinophagales bacterium]
MATRHKNLSFYKEGQVPSGEEMRIGIIVSEWNPEITDALLQACTETLAANKTQKENIFIVYVPGSFELPSAAQMLMEGMELDAIICLGCIIKGETQHDEYIANAIAHGIMMISVDYSTPVIFGVLTTNNLEQAIDRAGGKYGNKGTEAAIAALKMAALRKKLI